MPYTMSGRDEGGLNFSKGKYSGKPPGGKYDPLGGINQTDSAKMSGGKDGSSSKGSSGVRRTKKPEVSM